MKHSLSAVLLLLVPLALPTQLSSADTIILDFDSFGVTDVFGQTSGTFNDVPYGFSGLNNTQVQQSVLTAVTNHYLDYPTMSQDASSPLPDGFELDINFEIGTVGNAPANGDSDYFFIKIGDGLSGTNATNPGIFGAACLGCVRNAAGVGNFFGLPMGSVVGSVWTDHIDNIAFLATSDDQLINLIAGTTSHEIGHTLSLEHAGAQDSNPGQSPWGVMGSSATAMPSDQRVLDREFTYAKFGQLMGALGTRPVAVPEPSSLGLVVVGLGMVFRRKRSAA